MKWWDRITGKTRRDLQSRLESAHERLEHKSSVIMERDVHIFKLENAIADDDIEFLTHIKIKVGMYRDIEREVWAGSPTQDKEVEIKELSPSPFKGGKVVYDHDKNEGYFVTFGEDE